MDKAEYIAIRERLSFDKPISYAVMTAIVQLLWFAAAILLISADSVFAFIVAQLMLALFAFHAFGMLHEAGHGNIHERKWVNSLFGHFFGLFCFMPFHCWRHMHQGHHTWTGNVEKDPGSRMLAKVIHSGKVPTPYNMFWRLWFPLPALLQHVSLWIYPYRIWKEERTNMKLLKQVVFSFVFMALSYSVAFYFLYGVVSFTNVALAIYLYFILTEIINVPHHLGMPQYGDKETTKRMPLWQQHLSTRSCRYPGFLSVIMTLNFNYHTEHHFFPTLPWYRLKKASDMIKPKLGSAYNEVEDLWWNVQERRKNVNSHIFPVEYINRVSEIEESQA